MQTQLARASTPQMKTRRCWLQSERLIDINTLVLLETPCHQPCFRLDCIIGPPGEHPLRRNDVEPHWLVRRSKCPRDRQSLIFLDHFLPQDGRKLVHTGFSIRVRRRKLACRACGKGASLARWGLVETYMTDTIPRGHRPQKPMSHSLAVLRGLPSDPPPQTVSIPRMSPSFPRRVTALHVTIPIYLGPTHLLAVTTHLLAVTTLKVSFNLPPLSAPQHIAILRVQDGRTHFPGSTPRSLWLRCLLRRRRR